MKKFTFKGKLKESYNEMYAGSGPIMEQDVNFSYEQLSQLCPEGTMFTTVAFNTCNPNFWAFQDIYPTYEAWAGSCCTGSFDTGHPPVDPCANLEQHAISLGMQSGVTGVDGTTMTAADQFCIKCQATLEDPMCDCCDTDYTYSDNVVTYNPDPVGIPPKEPFKDPGKAPLNKKEPKRFKRSALRERLQKLANVKKNK